MALMEGLMMMKYYVIKGEIVCLVIYIYIEAYISRVVKFFFYVSRFFSFLSSFHLSDCSFFIIIVFHSNAVLMWLTVSLSWEDEMFTTKKLFTYIHTSTKGDVFFSSSISWWIALKWKPMTTYTAMVSSLLAFTDGFDYNDLISCYWYCFVLFCFVVVVIFLPVKDTRESHTLNTI